MFVLGLGLILDSLGHMKFGLQFRLYFMYLVYVLFLFCFCFGTGPGQNGLVQLPLFAHFRVTRIEQRHQKGQFCPVLPSLDFLVLIFFQ